MILGQTELLCGRRKTLLQLRVRILQFEALIADCIASCMEFMVRFCTSIPSQVGLRRGDRLVKIPTPTTTNQSIRNAIPGAKSPADRACASQSLAENVARMWQYMNVPPHKSHFGYAADTACYYPLCNERFTSAFHMRLMSGECTDACTYLKPC